MVDLHCFGVWIIFSWTPNLVDLHCFGVWIIFPPPDWLPAESNQPPPLTTCVARENIYLTRQQSDLDADGSCAKTDR